jgi:hypothetical protein
MEIAMIMLTMPGPSAAATAMARIREGTVSLRSVRRIRISSVHPPK